MQKENLIHTADALPSMSRAGSSSADKPVCRFCGTGLSHTFVDLGTSPLCQRHVTPQRFNQAESAYPLHVYVCHECFLVQLPSYVAREEIFDGEYAYFSSYAMLEHGRKYVEHIIPKLGLKSGSHAVEVASNDGYLLQHFLPYGIRVLGIEPTSNTAEAARKKGVATICKFFGVQTAKEVLAEHGPADLMSANNVLAHVPDINDFVGGFKKLLAARGVATLEFPSLYNLIANNYFDTIYHEHFSYLSFTTVERIFAHHGLTLFDVEEIGTHGGSLRIFARHTEDGSHPVTPAVEAMKAREKAAGHYSLDYYRGFDEKVKETKRAILSFLIDAKRAGKSIAAYGAPGKGNTLLNYCGIRTDFIDYTVDRSPVKQGNYLPGTRIPICHPDKISQTKPDYLFLLAWNFKDEVMKQMAHVREWGCKFVVPLPEPLVLD
ncbi:class I SAM-dependent methyltransferase [Humisphaera borealis]|nr:class I SAM-dependent methyltransferase [Humisphaera borealis]